MSKGALRFRSEQDMPASMRKLYSDQLRGVAPPVAPATVSAEGGDRQKRRKYGNQITVVDGIRFDSKREARYYESLKHRRTSGEVAFFLRQVPIHLPGGTKLVVDFVVFYADGRPADFIDAKGRETKEFRIKKREVEHHYPFRLVLV